MQPDFTPIIDQVAALCISLLTILIGWLGVYAKIWLSKKIEIQTTQQEELIQSVYNEAAQRSMAYAESVVPGGVPKKGSNSDKFVGVAAGYLLKMWPEMETKAGMTPEKVQQTIVARLPSGEETDKAEAIVLAKASGVSAQQPKK